MPKFEVFIYGTVPDCMEIEAIDKDEAIEKAISEVLDRLEFCAELPGTAECVPPEHQGKN